MSKSENDLAKDLHDVVRVANVVGVDVAVRAAARVNIAVRDAVDGSVDVAVEDEWREYVEG